VKATPAFLVRFLDGKPFLIFGDRSISADRINCVEWVADADRFRVMETLPDPLDGSIVFCHAASLPETDRELREVASRFKAVGRFTTDRFVTQFDPAGFGLVLGGRWLRDDPASSDARVNMSLPMGLSS
jgi:hypothetical protein